MQNAGLPRPHKLAVAINLFYIQSFNLGVTLGSELRRTPTASGIHARLAASWVPRASIFTNAAAKSVALVFYSPKGKTNIGHLVPFTFRVSGSCLLLIHTYSRHTSPNKNPAHIYIYMFTDSR